MCDCHTPATAESPPGRRQPGTCFPTATATCGPSEQARWPWTRASPNQAASPVSPQAPPQHPWPGGAGALGCLFLFCWTRCTPTQESPALGLSSVVPPAPSPAAWPREENSSGTLGAVCAVWPRHPMSTVEQGRLPCALEHDPGAEREELQAAVHPGQMCSPPWAWWAPSMAPRTPPVSLAVVQVHMLCGWAVLKSGSWWVPQYGGWMEAGTLGPQCLSARACWLLLHHLRSSE